MPHLSTALKLHSKLTSLESRLNTDKGLLDRFPCGVLLLDARANLQHMNRAAEAVFHSTDGITWTRYGLVVSDAKASSELNKLISAVLETSNRNGMEPGGMVVVPRPSLRRPYEVLVAPLPSTGGGIFEKPAGGVVSFLTGLDLHPLPDASALRRRFHLTGAEARLAIALTQGKSLGDASTEFGITVSTARTQMKSVLSKTGVRRQSELVRVLMASLARFLR